MAPASTTADKADKAPAADKETATPPPAETPERPVVEPQSAESIETEARTVATFATGETSSTGVFVDLATGQVVTSQPVRGRQLVAPGGIIDPDRAAAIKAAKENYAAGAGAVVPGVAEATAIDAAQADRAAETV